MRAFALAGIDVAHHLLELLVGDLRPLLRPGIERVAHFAVLGEGHDLVDELVVDRLLDEEPAPGTAALPLVKEQAEVRALHGRVEIGVGEHDVRALPAQLERDSLEVVCAAASMIRWPTSVEPVKATLSIPGCREIAWPAVGP